MSSSITAPDSSFRADATTISVVGLAHATSHFFQLLLPPLFPWLATEFSLVRQRQVFWWTSWARGW
jgi:hypothetical protein